MCSRQCFSEEKEWINVAESDAERKAEMIRIVGCCLVFFGCIGLGWYLSGMWGRRIRIQEELDGLLQRLYGEIQYAGSDMAEIFGTLEKESTYFRGFWHNMQMKITGTNSMPLWEIWRRELNRRQLQKQCVRFLGQEERYILQEVGRSLGQTDRNGQLRMLEMHQKRLQNIYQKTQKEYAEKAKVCRVVSLTAGCFLVILFL